MSVEGQISQFAKLTASLRAEPTLRHKIRDKVNPHTVTLINVLNEFLEEAKKKLPNGCTQLAVIADNLDRIAPIIQDNGQTNHDEIFVDRSEQLKALDCHLIYTVEGRKPCAPTGILLWNQFNKSSSQNHATPKNLTP